MDGRYGAAGGGTSAAIVIFGAAVRRDGRPSTTLRRRVVAAAAFGRALSDPLYVPTGGVGRHGPAEADVMAALLVSLGVSPDAILRERTGTDTLASARACAGALRRIGHRGPVYAMSSAYHLPRCVVLLRLAGVPARAASPPPYPAARSFWLRWYWRLREALALPYDVAVMLLARPAPRARPVPGRAPRHARRRRHARRKAASVRA